MGVYADISNGAINIEINIGTPRYSVNFSVGIYTDINNRAINNKINIGTPYYSVNLSMCVYTDMNNNFCNHITFYKYVAEPLLYIVVVLYEYDK